MLYPMFAASAETYADSPAVIEPQQTWSYQQLHEKVLKCVSLLTSARICPGGRVVLLAQNGSDFVAATFAVAYCGAILVPLNTAYTPAELASYLADAQPIILLCEDRCAADARIAIDREELNCQLLTLSSLGSTPLESPPPPADISGKAIALYQYSTGSTGKPKRVMRRFQDLVNEANNFRATVNTSNRDRILAVAPFFHAHGFGNAVLAAAASGATLVTLPAFKSRKKVMSLLREARITLFPGVPFMFSILADAPSVDNAPLVDLRLAFSAGAALDEKTYRAFLEKFDVPVRQLYGTTETGAMSLNTGATDGEKWRSVGQPLANVEITIVDEQGQPVTTGNIGEVVVRSNAMTDSYANLAQASQESFRNNAFYTGDLGVMDADGYLTITGRKKFFINAAGNKVDPAEIEHLIQQHPQVEEVIVVGVQSDFGLEVVKAVVVAKSTIPEQAIRDCCIGKVADFKVPRIIEFRDEIPKSPLGKVLRKYLL